MIHKHVPAISALCVVALATAAQASQSAPRSDELRRTSDAIQSLVNRVSGSVVQVVVTGYQPYGTDQTSTRTNVAYERGRTIGSGVIIDSSGYIITNAHVVSGAERIDVVLPAAGDGSSLRLAGSARVARAQLVGVAPDLDLALISVHESNLPALRIAPYESVRQGQLVFAFGSPDGLRNTVTMGMVSAVARQSDPDSPIVYIQTDAAINPGNSGGPLVNADGELVGINTFIRSTSGGSEGLGFALPSALVAIAWPQLRDYGRLHRAATGVTVQTITPLLRAGLDLPTEAGVIVGDVTPGSSAEKAGVKIGDVITAIDEHQIDALTVPTLYLYLFTLKDGQAVKFLVRRGDESLTFDIHAVAVSHDCTRDSELIDPAAALVERLGILGSPVDDEVTRAMPQLRIPSGVFVTARVDTPRALEAPLEEGDVIHAVNGHPVSTPAELREWLAQIGDGAVVLQVERDGQLSFVPCQLE